MNSAITGSTSMTGLPWMTCSSNIFSVVPDTSNSLAMLVPKRLGRFLARWAGIRVLSQFRLLRGWRAPVVIFPAAHGQTSRSTRHVRSPQAVSMALHQRRRSARLGIGGRLTHRLSRWRFGLCVPDGLCSKHLRTPAEDKKIPRLGTDSAFCVLPRARGIASCYQLYSPYKAISTVRVVRKPKLFRIFSGLSAPAFLQGIGLATRTHHTNSVRD